MADVTLQEETSSKAGNRPWSELVATLPEAPVNEYRTFSSKKAASFTGIGGLLGIVGALGTWVRETEADSLSEIPKDVGAVMGYASAFGWALAAVGLLAAVGSFAWFMRNRLSKLIPAGASAVFAGAVVFHVLSLRDRYEMLIDRASATLKRTAETDSLYHAGFGWGAWALLAAAVLLVVGTVIGILRELDVRRGLSE